VRQRSWRDDTVDAYPPEARADKYCQEQDFGRGEEIAYAGAGFHADVVGDGQDTDEGGFKIARR